MKKITLLIAVLALGVFFVSCNKEGKYNPKNKIDRIYQSSSYKYEVNHEGNWETEEDGSTPKHVREIWNWDGNVLKSISYYNSDGSMEYTEDYGYDGKRLVSISRLDREQHWELNYEKGKLSTMDLYDGTNKAISYEFIRDNGNISEIKISVVGGEKSAVTRAPMNALRFFIPAANTESMMMAMAKINERHTTKNAFTYSIKLEWDGKNISKTTYELGAYKEAYEFTYDEKLNPFYGMFDIEQYDAQGMLSKNNVTRYVSRDSDNDIDERNYTYTYSGKVPSSRSYVNAYNTEYSRSTYTYSDYYEYK